MVVANAVAALSEINDSSPTGTGIELMLGIFWHFFVFFKFFLLGRVSVAELVMIGWGRGGRLGTPRGQKRVGGGGGGRHKSLLSRAGVRWRIFYVRLEAK